MSLVRSLDPGLQTRGFKLQFPLVTNCAPLAKFTYVCLTFLVYKMGMMIISTL